MKNYFTRLWAYHQRFFRLYLLVLVAVYGVYLLHLPTPLSLILRPFGLKAWSTGLTRASVRLLHLDWQGAWDYNPLIYPLVVYILTYFFLFPIFSDKKIIEKYHKKMETINKIEDEFTKSQNKIKLIIDMMMYEKNNKECKKEA